MTWLNYLFIKFNRFGIALDGEKNIYITSNSERTVFHIFSISKLKIYKA